MKNQFKNDTERIQELKTCLETSLQILDDCDNIEDGYLKTRTLIKDVLARYSDDKKFLTDKKINTSKK